MTSSAPSRLLGIPPEMGNRIYGFSLTTDEISGSEIDICDAAPPSKALFLTCKQIHGEGTCFLTFNSDC